MNIALLGYGSQGQSAFEYWSNDGNNHITICDRNLDISIPPGAAKQLGSNYLENLDKFDLLVRTPALHPNDIIIANSETPSILNKVTTVTNEFFRVCPSPIIGITGTKGKGTTSTLIAKIIEASGRTVHLGGNIGIPPLELLKQNISSQDIVVLELANFQLIDLKYSPFIGVCLMVAPEHLDWHSDLYEYIHAKQQLFVQQKGQDLAVFNARNELSEEVISLSLARKLGYEVPEEDTEPDYTQGAYVQGKHIMFNGKKVCNTKDVKLFGRHNLENVSAAIAATWDLIGHNSRAVKKALHDFTGLEHRLEVIRVRNKVTFVNDSFGTTPETAIVAIKAFTKPKVLILGGSSKNSQYDELAKTVADSNIRHIIAIGTTGPEIANLIKHYGSTKDIPITHANDSLTMQEIVATAANEAKPGDVVLLSTGCASFDMFRDYKDRGEQFKQAVAELS